jgi:hypothetical protein
MAISRRAYLLALTLMAGLLLAFAGVASATALDTLKQPPFPPTDVDLFDPGVYSEASPLVPAGETANDNATLRKQLKALLVKRFGSGSSQVKQGLAKFDAASTKRIVPHPRLRAALVALKGTVGQPSTASWMAPMPALSSVPYPTAYQAGSTPLLAGSRRSPSTTSTSTRTSA